MKERKIFNGRWNEGKEKYMKMERREGRFY